MEFDSSRRRFLQAGLILPAAGLVASHHLNAFCQTPAGVAYRTLGKTGLKVSSVGAGVGIIPDSAVLARVRIAHARRLLLTTALPMSEVAAHCGYESAPVFTRAFLRATGNTPLSFRRRRDGAAFPMQQQ